VLNSFAEEKGQASLRVLAQNGRFLEIGKFDLSNDTSLGKQELYSLITLRKLFKATLLVHLLFDCLSQV
jgi:hypothetical protein